MQRTANRRVGILATTTAPLLPMLIQRLQVQGIGDLVLILDSRLLSQKDRRIFQERTHGAFDDQPSLYDLPAKVPAYFVRNHNGCAELVRRLGCALLLNGGTPRKLNSEVLAAPTQGVINVHPGLLPHYRGASCVEWAIYNDDPIGLTAHFMNEAYDEGPLIEAEHFSPPSTFDYTDIRVQMYRDAQRLMAKAARRVLDRGLCPADCQPQGEGTQYRPIPDDKFEAAKARIRNGRYSHVSRAQNSAA